MEDDGTIFEAHAANHRRMMTRKEKTDADMEGRVLRLGYRFRVVGTGISSPVRADFHTAAMDAIAADYADWGQGGVLELRDGGVVEEVL